MLDFRLKDILLLIGRGQTNTANNQWTGKVPKVPEV